MKNTHRDPTAVFAAIMAPWKWDFGCDGVALIPKAVIEDGHFHSRQKLECSYAVDPEPDTLRELGLDAIRWAIRLHEQAVTWEAEAYRRHDAGEPQRAYDEAPKDEHGGCADREVREAARRSEAIAGLAGSARKAAEDILKAAVLMHFGRIDRVGQLDDLGEGWESAAVIVDRTVYIVAPDPNGDEVRPPQLATVDWYGDFDEAEMDR